MEWAGGSGCWAGVDVGHCRKIKEKEKEGEGEEVGRGERWARLGLLQFRAERKERGEVDWTKSGKEKEIGRVSLRGFFRLELLKFLSKTTTRIQTKQMQRHECIKHLVNPKLIKYYFIY
jgi:hypothetical protein